MTKGILIVLAISAVGASSFFYLKNQQLSKEIDLVQQHLREQKDSLKRLQFSEQFMAEKVRQLTSKLNDYQKINLSNDSLYFLHQNPATQQRPAEIEAVTYTTLDTSELQESFIGLKQYIQNQNIGTKTAKEQSISPESPKATEQAAKPTLKHRSDEFNTLNFNALNMSLPTQLETKKIETTEVALASLNNLHYLFALDDTKIAAELKPLGYTHGENTTYFINKNTSYCCFSVEKSANKVSIFNSLKTEALLKELQAQQIPQLTEKDRRIYRYIWNSNIYELQYQTNYAGQVNVSLQRLYNNKKSR
ncbi:MAG: hypothetical protein RQ756_05150 [Flavobacteriaceae bacterium]|nr:hypothetical protein [Flavobacteriaceae bacterium]